MTISAEQFAENTNSTDAFNLANIADFNSLIAQSQKYNVPVFALNDAQIEQVGVILEGMRESRDRFRGVFEELAENIHSLTQNV